MPSLRKRQTTAPPEFDLGTAGTETQKRSRKIIVAGLILAVCAGVGSFVLITRAQGQVTATSVPMTTVVVAARVISAQTALSADDLIVRSVPSDPTNQDGTFSSTAAVLGRVTSITVLPGQLITSNLFTFSADSGALEILSPGETMSATSPDWRAVSLSVPDDRAVGGMLTAGEHVDILVTTSVLVPQTVLDKGQYYGDKTTKVTYQDVPILSKTGSYYVVKVTIQAAEEIAQLQASGAAQFSLALRPDIDSRSVDTSKMGETTNAIIERYGMPLPPVYPPTNGAIPPQPPIGTPTPAPTAVIQAVAPSATP